MNDSDTTASDRPTTEIEISPEMMEAGERAYWESQGRGDGPTAGEVCYAVFKAMAALSPKLRTRPATARSASRRG
jgi:hypothetical protein